MSDLELIQHLSSLGVRLWVEGDVLKYSAPRGVLTEDLRARLRARKDALRAFLSRAGRSLDTGVPQLTRVPRGEPLPLSFGQERLWFLHQLDPGDPSYVVPLLIRFEGPLDAGALERALSALVRRHEVLRTTFALAGDRPVAVIHEAAALGLPKTTFAALPESEHEAAARAEIAAELRRPFDLATGPLLRPRLFELAALDHVLLLVAHHIVTDGQTSDLLRREIGALYAAFAAGLPSPLEELPFQYADFAAWQRRWLTADVVDEQLAYWRARLAEAPRTLDLPFDRPRPLRASHEGDLVRFAVDADTSRALDDLSRREGATLFMTLLAAFAALLARWSGQDDLCIGTPTGGRPRPDLEAVAGFFVNTLVLRVRADASLTFRELLAAVREDCLGAYAHQELPFERLVQELDPDRDPSRTPLFQVMFSLRSAPAAARPAPAAPAAVPRRGVGVTVGAAKFDLTLAMEGGAGGLAGGMELASDLFDRSTVERMLSSFRRLLGAVVVDPAARLWQLPLLGEAEARQLVDGSNATAFEHRRDRLLHEVFADQAALSPDAPALIGDGHTLTYGALAARANRLARALQRRGVGPDVVVAIHLERSIEMVVAIYAVLAAGGAYAPLDPGHPRERLAFMLEDSRPRLIITDERLASGLPPHHAAVLRIDADHGSIEAEVETALDRGALALEHLAYVIFTSGSTGRPKGAMNTHGGILNRLSWMQHTFPLRDHDCVLQKTPVTFDVSVWELFWPLMFGARLVVARPEGHKDPSYLAAIIAAERVTTVHFVPSMLDAFAATLTPGERAGCSPLRRVFSSGEALPPALADRCLALFPGIELHNLYGPTEAAVDVTWWTCRPGAPTVPIGWPVHNTHLYVLDGHLQPVPAGVRGELYIGGAQVGRGYLGRPDLTAARFVPDPFDATSGARMYVTGDVARILHSGEIEYLGRADHQVKIRGHRIELGEIEAALDQHADVREVVVIAREDTPGDKRLVAYVVAKDPEAPALPVAELRAFAKERLPEHMIPAAFVALAALPLTSNGKLDRRALPAPEAGALARGEYVPPRGPVEAAIAGIFAEVLGLPPERVGAHDGFFELGGHSLLATMVAVRLRTALGVELPLRAVFEAPTPAGLALHVAAALADGDAPVASPILRAPPGVPPVLSFAQERLWFLDQLAPGDPSYVVPLAMRLAGALDAGALEHALREIVRRHEVLRTCLTARGGAPSPVLHDAVLPLRVSSYRALSAAEREALVRREAAAEASRPFDLAADLPIRARLLDLDEEDHLLLVSMHHAVSDAWSMGVFGRELAALYGAFARDLPSPLPELPIQYADYAAWQRAWLSGETLGRQLAYWKQHLAGAPRAIDLPTDRPRPPLQRHRGAQRGFALTAELSDALAGLSRELHATLFMTLLAAFDVLLHRYSGQDDLVVGTPIAGRTRAETEGLIGFFVNTLALRAELPAEATFAELVAQVKETCLGAYAHQDVPFEHLVHELDPERDLGRSPLFQVMFALQNAPGEPIALPGLERRRVGAGGTAAKFDLTLALAAGPRGIAGTLEYATDLFDEATIERLAGHYRALLAAAVASPRRKLWALDLLGEDERRRVLVEWNATHPSYPRDATIHTLFAAQAAATPEAPALVCGSQRLDYRELDRRANRLAHLLRARGVGLETPVGLFAQRSVEMVVATLAILKAGGAYVPLLPELPDARLAWMVADARVTVIVAAGIGAAERQLGAVAVLDMAAEASRLEREPDGEPLPVGTGESLAYVMYTSGSTGTPKGVGVVHRGVVRLVKDASYARFGADEVFLQLAPIGFDAATLEIWGPLLNGGRLVVFPPERPSPALLDDVIRAQGVTTLWLTAGLFNAIVDERPEALRPLRRLLAGGEALSVPHVQKALALLPAVALVNGYGPTEGTTFTCCHPVTAAAGATSIPIGRPIAGTQVYVLDDRRAPVPVGVPGELYLGGDGLARGYLGRPELTAERFVPDPFAVEAGGRLYRTGDCVRWLADGTLAFLGRLDQQVKLRGFRIEPGEVEAAIGAYPGFGAEPGSCPAEPHRQPAVRACVVVVREDAPGDRRLVAYVVGTPAAAELRAWLEARLPEHLIPSSIVALDELPLTRNGKVDRRALPAPTRDLAALGEHVAPRGPIEETLAAIFADVLGVPVDQVGAHDGFFALGGHSLLATKVIARVRVALSVELPLRALFEAPTVADLAARVGTALAAGDAPLAPPLVATPRTGPGPLSFAQERLWFLHQLDPADASYVVPLVTRLDGPLDVAALAHALREIERRHEVLRTAFPLVDGRPVALAHPESRLDLPLTSLGPGELRRALAAEVARPFDLAEGPVIRARLFALGPDEHVLCVAMHHVVADGWTVGVLNREIGALYEAFSQGRPSPLPPLPIQYADYAAWQRGWLTGEALDAQLAYWKRRLAGAPTAIDLPTDRPRPARPTHRGGRAAFALDAETTRALRALGAREGVTLFMTLLAAFDVLLFRWSGQTDIVVGTPIANRTHAETDGLVGFFVNTLVLRAQLDPDLPFRQLLPQVREDALGAYAHQATPFERLVQELDPARDPSRTPLFQVMFALQTAPTAALQLGGLQRRGVDADVGTAKFDLTLALVDGPGGLSGGIELALDLFDAATVERLLASFRALLEGIVARPEQRLVELPILPAGEAQRLLAQAGGAATYPPSACLHELFAAQARRAPDAVAVSFERESLTYGELDRRAGQVARALRQRGVGPDTLVGLGVDRGAAMIVGLVGILAAGGAYLPLDPDYPGGRLAFMIADARVPVVLTLARYAHLFAQGPELLFLDAEPDASSAEAIAPAAPARPHDLAYVIYTSGSTGAPKGVMVTHHNVVRLFEATARWYRFDDGDVWTLFHSYAFDFSVWEIWGALLHGGRLLVVPYWVSRSPEAFHDLLVRERVTVLNQTPSAFRPLIRADHEAGPARRRALALRYVIFGGEALDVGDLRPFWDNHGDAEPQLVNMYGITETTVHVTARPVTRADLARPWSSVIGEPLADLQVHVLDERRQQVPVGVVGELYVGGAGVARGYLGRPELTAQRFLADPFHPHPGERLYRTGDRGRHLADGSLEYLGRSDLQVKIRGFRIELGEIEAALEQHPAVREAVVMARVDGEGDARLVAYVVAAAAMPAAELRAFLKDRLPEHMVPAAFVALAALPLTPNGKVDRRALADVAPGAEATAAADYVAPRGPVEEALAEIFGELLAVPRVGAHDGFFDRGGHSLLAAQAVARIRAVLGVDLPLRTIFEAPSPAELRARVDNAREDATTPIPRAPRDRPLEASFGQERLWALQQIEPDDASYVVPLTVRIPHPLDADVLESALREIVRRHEVLRTTFALEDGRPVQVIHEDGALRLRREDLRHLPRREAEVLAREASRAEARACFDLARGPLLRARLLALADDDHLLLLSMHHVVADAWSVGVLLRELDALQDAFAEGRPSPLPELPIQYADFAAWQRGRISGELLDRQLAYWRRALGGAASVTDLPLDRPRPPMQSHRGARRAFVLPVALAGALVELGRREHTTVFMTLLAAFQVLLFRHTGQEDLSVGTPIANRSRAETEGLIGFFLNTLVLRAELSPELSFRAHLARVREACLGAYAHQDLPFERLVQELDPARDLSRSPLFQVLFTLHDTPAADASPRAPLESRAGVADAAVAKFDLSLAMGRTPGGGLAGSFEYATDLFDAATIERLTEHFAILLEGVVQDPSRPLRELPLLADAERRRVLLEWNDTTFGHPADTLLHEQVAAQAARTPAAVAVSFAGAELRYAELDARANRLARVLRRHGVRGEALVGVCMERSLDLLVALLAVLAAGGAYVPLDPEYPKDRLAFMIEDARPRVILTQAHLADLLPEQAAPVLRVDVDWHLAAAEPADPLPRDGLTPESLAYVIYTSGSTGRPKGVMNEHRGVMNRLAWGQHVYRLGADDRVLQKTPFSFDVSVWELFWPLLSGAELVMARPGGHREPGYLVDTIASRSLTVVHFVPSMLAIFLDELSALGAAARVRCASLRRVFCSGEALSPALAARFFAALPDVELHNLYGPTEAAIEVTAGAVAPGSAVVTIGRPIHNTRMYVLDALLEPAPVGVRGELYIGGVQVARGYWNRPELTAERFVRDPFSTAEGARLYRTGDVARWLPSGEIEYLGRADFQIKLRGFRIELGEIEATLLAHAAVREAVVVLREDAAVNAGGPRLVAYLVARDEAPLPTVDDLRAFLADRLPDYMIPAGFVALPALPLTGSGKVDRRALPAPEEGVALSLGAAFTAPATHVEETLAGIWAGVLRREAVGVHDNFFALGGDSILAIQIIARAQAAGIRVTPRQIFQYPTVAALGAVATTGAAIDAEQGSVTGPVIATPIQRWWLDQRLADAHHYNQSFFFEVQDPLDAAVLDEVVARLLEHHDALRLRVGGTAEAPALRLAPVGDPAQVRRIDLAGVPETERRIAIERAAAEAQSSLDLEAGPVLRAVLFDLGPKTPSRLLLVIHHLAVDGVSWRILLHDLWSAYDARRGGHPLAFPPKTTSFQRWSEKLSAHARSPAVDAERGYWLGQLHAGALRLPQDHAEGEDVEASGRAILCSLSEADTEALLTRVPDAYRTQINDALLTALAQAIGRWAAPSAPEAAVLLDLEGHGREELFDDVDLTRTVGWFTTLFPVVLHLRADAGPGDALRAVKEQLRAIPGRGLGYGLLRWLAPPPPSGDPLAGLQRAEISFNYLGQFDQAVPAAAPFRVAREASGPSHAPRARRPHLLEVTASVSGGRLQARWAYSENRHRRDTVQALADGWLDALRALIDHCLSAGAGGATPSDFENAHLTQEAVDMLAGLDPEG